MCIRDSQISAGGASPPTNAVIYVGQVGQSLKVRIGGRGITVAVGNCSTNRFDATLQVKNRGTITIGDGTSMGGVHIQNKGAEVYIGRECMFSEAIDIFCTRVHALIEIDGPVATKITRPVRCIIQDKVWIGRQVNLLPGANIGQGSIIGAHSVAAGKIGENCTAAGNPCKVIRENMTWSRRVNSIDPATRAYLTDQVGCTDIIDTPPSPNEGEHAK